MSPELSQRFDELLSMRSKPHHSVSPGPGAPAVVECIVEMYADCPVKIELSKESGLPRVDRPVILSSRNTTPYGLIPQTYCGPRIAELCMKRNNLTGVVGDGDPLDICVLTSAQLPLMAGLQMKVRVIGGLAMVDRCEADDKILAVLENDLVHGGYQDITDVPEKLLEQIEHYFLSYKRPPSDTEGKVVRIPNKYGRDAAHEVILASMADYVEKYKSPTERLQEMRDILAADLVPAHCSCCSRHRKGRSRKATGAGTGSRRKK